MINTEYGDIPKSAVENYLKSLVNKTFKILPMKEEKLPTLQSYIESFIRELVGANTLMFSERNDKVITLISTMTYLATEDYDVAVCKKEVFKCIRILNELSNDLSEV